MFEVEIEGVSGSSWFGLGEGLGLGVGVSVWFGEFWSGEGIVARTDLSKLNNPKGSKIKNPPKYKKFLQKPRKRTAFLIALIDNLSYNRICVNSVGLYTFDKEYASHFGVALHVSLLVYA